MENQFLSKYIQKKLNSSNNLITFSNNETKKVNENTSQDGNKFDSKKSQANKAKNGLDGKSQFIPDKGKMNDPFKNLNFSFILEDKENKRPEFLQLITELQLDDKNLSSIPQYIN